MSMHISNSTSFAATLAISRRPHELRHDFRDLRQALHSGDLAVASSAYAALASDAPNVLSRKPDGPFAQIGTALAAGDIAGAQSAYSTMVKSHLPNGGGQVPTLPPQNDPLPSSPVSLTTGLVNLMA